MKHFIFLLYLLSYTTGISSIVLLSVNYLRYNRLRTLRDLIFFNLFFTLFVIFDTLNYYFPIIAKYNSAGFQIFILLGLFLAAVGMAYFIGIYVSRVLNRELNNIYKIVFWGGAIFTCGILILLFILYQNSLVPKFIAFHTGFTITNFFIFLAIGYNLYLLGMNLNKFGIKEKRLLVIILVSSFILLPVSILSNLILYQVHSKYPIAFSPLCYFVINLAMIFFNIRNSGMPAEITNPRVVKNESSLLSHRSLPSHPSLLSQPKITKEHNITDRELEVLQLILDGYSNHEIGKKLFISSNTVRNHVYNIFKKFGVKSRYELIKFFY